MKNFINNIFRKVGYQISKFDPSPYLFRDKLKEFLDKNVSGNAILDIGSAQWNYPKEHFSNVTTLDMQPPADIIGDVMNLPFKDGSFDCIICLETLEHVENPFKAMNEIHRTLKSGGMFIGSTPFSHKLHGEEYGDYWRFTRQCWQNLLMKNFKNISVTPYAGKLISPGWYLVTGIK
ncbi:MAG: class I SAM-dependent methyltransferase [Candidatus Pacebacteria bacterium]|nr:class I SAM-dependent methyltransferase [Candidatus Paceibacterota bacterium]